MQVGTPLFSLSAGDFNSDGKLDLIGSNFSSNYGFNEADLGIYILFGKGNGTFATPRKYAPGIRAQPLVIYDFNGDGKSDIATVSIQNLTIFLGDGAGNFSQPSLFPLTPVPSSFSPYRDLALGDFNSDGKPDIAIANGTFESVEILTGNGVGGFSAPLSFIVGTSYSLAVGDYNADGLSDIASASYGASIISVLLNNSTSGKLVTTVSGASYQSNGVLSGDAIASAFGVGMTTATLSAETLPLPTTLGGVTVKVKDRNGIERIAQLYFVSPSQINYLMPSGLALGGALVTIQNNNTVVSTGTVMIDTTAPGLFAANADGAGAAAANVLRIKPNGERSNEQIYVYDVVQKRFLAREIVIGGDELFLELYGTGIRQSTYLESYQVKFGNISGTVLYAGPQCCYVGVDQINVKIPSNVAGKGLVNIELTVDGKVANPVQLNFK